eukprot:5091324-Pleurochrysis_carterae.AAC.2
MTCTIGLKVGEEFPKLCRRLLVKHAEKVGAEGVLIPRLEADHARRWRWRAGRVVASSRR